MSALRIDVHRDLIRLSIVFFDWRSAPGQHIQASRPPPETKGLLNGTKLTSGSDITTRLLRRGIRGESSSPIPSAT
jgi:hypothetical protein